MIRPRPAGPVAPRRRYVPLTWRVAILNAGLLVAAVIVTIVVLAPHKLSTFALDEAAVLAGGLVLVALGNLVLLRRIVRPLEELTELARRVDLSHPVRIPDATPDSEAGELALTFNEMLTRLEVERLEATGRVLAGQEAERLRIARELHDQIGQELTAALLGLARLRSAAAAPELADHVRDVQETIRSSLEDVRRISLELRPEALDELGLVSALAVLGERFAERSGIAVVQDIAEALPAIAPESELVVYRVVQEALTNVARHSGATRATMTLRADGSGGTGMLYAAVADAGQGLPPGSVPGTGIRGMQERAALVGGRLELRTGPGGLGTVVALTIASADPAAADPPPDSRPPDSRPPARRPAAGSVAGRDALAHDADPAR